MDRDPGAGLSHGSHLCLGSRTVGEEQTIRRAAYHRAQSAARDAGLPALRICPVSVLYAHSQTQTLLPSSAGRSGETKRRLRRSRCPSGQQIRVQFISCRERVPSQDYAGCSRIVAAERGVMNPFPQFLFVAQSTANLKPEEPCVCIHKSWRNSAIASVTVD